MIRILRPTIVAFFLSVSDIFWCSFANAEIVLGDVPLDTNPNISVGRPKSYSASSVLISRKQYVISWNMQRHIPEWVAWVLSRNLLGDTARTDNFRHDQDLDDYLLEQNLHSVAPKDYKNSCLDRGHQVPSGDRTASESDNESTFFMSNVMPQSAYLNRRLWASLEKFLRKRVLEKNELVQMYVGYSADPKMHSIGPQSDIHVPATNFKIIVLLPAANQIPSRSDIRFFVVNFPNLTSRGTHPVEDREQACWDSEHMARLEDGSQATNWRPYLSSLSEVEKIGELVFDFLPRAKEMTPAEVDGLISEVMMDY